MAPQKAGDPPEKQAPPPDGYQFPGVAVCY